MDIGIEKIPYDFNAICSHPLKGENAAIGTADVKKESHYNNKNRILYKAA
jgi:hypothetical protein